MIKVTRLDGTVLVINADLLEFVEETPDTILSLINDKKVMVREPADEIIEKVIAFKRRIHLPTVIRPQAEGAAQVEGPPAHLLPDAGQGPL